PCVYSIPSVRVHQQLFHHPHSFQSRCHVMRTDDRDTLSYCPTTTGQCGGQPAVHLRRSRDLAQKGFARNSEQQWPLKPCKTLQIPQQLQIVPCRLAKSNADIEHHLRWLHSAGGQMPQALAKKSAHFFDNVAISRADLHCLRRALHVHQHV